MKTMPEAETMTKYTTLVIYLAPLAFSLPFWLQLIAQEFPQWLSFLNINLTTWYVTTALFYLGVMWVVEIGWSAVSVLADGQEVKNITFGAIIFIILAALTFMFGAFVFLGWYTFTNPTYNVIVTVIETLGIILFLWQARTILSESVRSNHIFNIAANG